MKQFQPQSYVMKQFQPHDSVSAVQPTVHTSMYSCLFFTSESTYLVIDIKAYMGRPFYPNTT